MLYCNGAVPPVPVAVMVPSFMLHDEGVTVAVINGPAAAATTTVLVPIHPALSLIYTI